MFALALDIAALVMGIISVVESPRWPPLGWGVIFVAAAAILSYLPK